jgi:cation:H+ antiporter
VGSVFIALATSLPELATCVAAVLLGAPDLAAGNLIGAGMTNMLTLAVVSLIPGADLFRRAAIDNGLAASLAITLMALVAILVLLRPATTVLGVGVGPWLLAIGYLAGVRTLFRNSGLARMAAQVEETSGERPEGEAATTIAQSRRVAAVGFVRAATAIFVAAPAFAVCADALARETGVAASFVGTLLVSVATTLPELVTSLAAVRLRAYDLAVGNLFGSNALNVALFAVVDVVQPGASLFATISSVHALSAMLAVLLMGIALAAIVYRAEGKLRALEPSSALMIGVYAAGMWLVYAFTLRA